MDYAWYGQLMPDGVVTVEDDARISDGPFDISLIGGVLAVEFADLSKKADARAVGLGYVAELAIARRRDLTWAPNFRATDGGATVHEGYFDAAARFGVKLGKTLIHADGRTEVVRADSIDSFRSEGCIRANENLREVRKHLAASLEHPRHEDLQRAHDRLRREIGARNGVEGQRDRDQALAALVGEAASWSADVGQSLASTRHILGTPPQQPLLTQDECADRLRRIYVAAAKAWCP